MVGVRINLEVSLSHGSDKQGVRDADSFGHTGGALYL